MDKVALTFKSIADRYHIGKKIGAGGMADVYLARDLRHDRDVALKVMRPELAQTLGPERFLREIRLLARLQHPNIVGLVDSGEAAGLVYYVMPYLAAGSLRDRLKRERELPIAEALRILREIAGALGCAHPMGIVHRDIKPENVLFNAGHAQVTDFGIAHIASELDRGAATTTALTTAGVVIGTPQYMAPEQAAGDPKIDHRADLYSFGVLAYESLAGVPPFVAGSAAELAALRLTTEPDSLASRRPSVPEGLGEVIMRCLERRPADRWQSAEDLIAALERINDPGSAARPPSKRAGTVSAQLLVTESMARHLDRTHFDPRMIGDAVEYLDNQAASDVLVLLLNAVWLDGSDFEPHLRLLPYRCIAPTLYGFSPNARHRFPLGLGDHTTLLSELLESKVRECHPSLVIGVGFSASGDLLLRLGAAPPDGMRAPDGILALGPNQGIETCFISRVVATLESNDPALALAAFRSISETASSLDDWLLLNAYAGRMLSRFRGDFSPLKILGRDIIAPFERDNAGAFAEMYREAAARIRRVRCVFEDSEECSRLLRNVLTDHMDRRVLGEHHRDGSLVIEPTPSHFDLLQPDRIASHLASMVEELRADGT